MGIFNSLSTFFYLLIALEESEYGAELAILLWGLEHEI
jgi:hypothetical protein